MYRKGFSAEQIALQRNLKLGTIWNHFEQLIEHGHLPVQSILSYEKIKSITAANRSEKEKLTTIMLRISGSDVTFDEIACVRASLIWRMKLRMIAAHSWKRKKLV